jgi:PKD repeat protein
MPAHRSAVRAAFVIVGAILGVATCREVQDPVAPPVSASGDATPPALTPNLSTSTSAPVVLIGAGDIGSCVRTQDDATANLLDAEIAADPDAVVFTLGDNAYDTGTADEFTNCYGPTWGRHKARTRPAPGNKDYTTAGAPGYFGYFTDVLTAFGATATDPATGYYSYDVGDWHVIVLNDNVSMTATSAQITWLKADLAASTKQCTLAYWHAPRFYSNGIGAKPLPAWDALYAAGAEIVLNGDRRNYERFAMQRPDGTADPEKGIRQFVVGTAGGGSYVAHSSTISANSEARIKQYGVLKLTLGAGTYSWKFVPIAGKTETDEGTGSCSAGAPPVARPGGPYTSTGSVTFDGSASSDPQDDVPLTYEWDFGDPADPTTGSGATPTHVYAAPGSYTVTLVVTDSEGNRSAPATTSVVISAPPSGTAAVLIGAGDVGSCNRTQDEETARLLDAEIAAAPNAIVFTLGDNVYDGGTADEFTNCYGPTWGRHKARTRPALGNKDYTTADAPGYFGYFGDILAPLGEAAGDPDRGYYSYDVGAWHVVVLNQNAPIGIASNQIAWLKADLAASTKECTIAYWHNPRFFSNGSSNAYKPAWDVLYTFGAELVLNADRRNYERFAPQNPDGVADPVGGIRQIIAGTGGGEGLMSFGTPIANSEVRIKANGVLKLTLDAGTYSWKFMQISGVTSDQGSGSCHPGPPPIARPGGPYVADGSLTVDGSASSDPQGDALTYEWDFGDPANPTDGTGVTPTHVYTAPGTYTVTLIVTDSRGHRSEPATTTVEIRNLAPVVEAGAERSVTTGSALVYTGSFTDATNGGPWPYRIQWGDGTADVTSTAVAPGSIGASHTYTTAGTYTVTVTVTDAAGLSNSDQTTVQVLDPVANVTMLAVGDIASCASNDLEDEMTARIADAQVLAHPNAVVFTLGDNAYPSGRAEDYANCYDPTWGRHKGRTWANLGNHEYDTGTADPSFDYFGDRIGPRGKGYYSLNIGDWHVIVLNDNASQVPIASGSEQDLWLQADLAANTKLCTLAIWHQPFLYSANSGSTMKRSSRKILWDRLWARGVDITLNGHEHQYERFAPMNPAGALDEAGGIRSFIVGTGGESVRLPTGRAANSEVLATAFGVLKLTLGGGWYEWEFIPIAGETFTDSGSGVCH